MSWRHHASLRDSVANATSLREASARAFPAPQFCLLALPSVFCPPTAARSLRRRGFPCPRPASQAGGWALLSEPPAPFPSGGAGDRVSAAAPSPDGPWAPGVCCARAEPGLCAAVQGTSEAAEARSSRAPLRLWGSHAGPALFTSALAAWALCIEGAPGLRNPEVSGPRSGPEFHTVAFEGGGRCVGAGAGGGRTLAYLRVGAYPDHLPSSQTHHAQRLPFSARNLVKQQFA